MQAHRMLGAVAVAATVLAAGCTSETNSAPTTTAAGVASAPAVVEIVDETAWPMHHIDGRYRGANALGTADVDGNGHADYVTNYEFDQRWILALHPGEGQDVRRSWPTVEIWSPEPLVEGNGKNPESTALGDFDGDGTIDAVGAHGFSDIGAWEGSAPGVHLVWGPERARITDPDAWVDGGWVPSTVDVGHPHWVAAHDVNGDGLTDVAVGGRLHGGGGGYENPDSPNGNGTYTGLGWLEAPADPSARRDLAQWRFHRVDADEFSGHGFDFVDLDGDGDDDIIDANADFDTPQDREEVAWYENPGNGSEAQRAEWRRTTLVADPGFYAKPSVAAGDLDGDGDVDLVTQTDDDLLLFRSDGGSAPTFEVVRLPKPDAIAWRSRAVRLADVDGDGGLDIIGMLIHDDNVLPADKASVYVLRNEGRPFEPAGWRLLPVSWGSGTTMLIPGFGEKWDQVDVTDVDGDGDLDIVANCEEWWVEPQGEVVPFFTDGLATSSVAVVWFENTLGDTPAVHREVDGVIELEAEHPTVIGDATWVERSPVRGDASATVAVQALNSQAPDGDVVAADGTAGWAYDLEAAGGDYVVWARVRVPSAWAPALGGDASNSAWITVDGGETAILGDEPGLATDTWVWVRVAEPVPLRVGSHRLVLGVRELGLAVDRLVLAADPAYVPTD